MERINRTFREGFRKFATHAPELKWYDFLGEILAGLRFLSTRSHGNSPYYLAFKQEVVHPAHLIIHSQDASVDWWANDQ